MAGRSGHCSSYSPRRTHSFTTHTPGSTVTYTVPVSTLIVKLLSEPIEGSLSTRETLEQARADGVPLSHVALAWLSRAPTTSPATSPAVAPVSP